MRLQRSTSSWRALLGLLSLSVLSCPVALAWTLPRQRILTPQSSPAATALFLAQGSDANTQEAASFSRESMQVNGDSGGSRIIPAAMSGKSQLAAAFTALDESDQYDAVLTGLCAKILDKEGDVDAASLDDSAALLTEMNQRRIPASPRSLMALIDVSTTIFDWATIMLL